jgi:hypothetical protein
MRFAIAIGALLLCAGDSPAQVTAIGSGYALCQNTLPLDSNGWTVFTQTTGAIYYVSTTEGNDSNNGLSSVANFNNTGGAGAAGPKRTIAAAQALMTAGNPDWMLLKKGDIFANQWFATFFGNGKNCLELMVVGSYDPHSPGVVDPYGNNMISSLSWSGGVVTATTTGSHGYTTSQAYQLVVSGAVPDKYNGSYAATITGANTFTYALTNNPGAETTPGVVTTQRPLVEPNIATHNACMKDAGSLIGNFVAIVGIECYAATRDPGSATFDKTTTGTDQECFVFGSPYVYKLFEDTKCSYFSANFSLNPNPKNAITARRSISAFSYTTAAANGTIAHVGGWYEESTHYLKFDGFLIDTVGWNPTLIAGASVTMNCGTSAVTWVGNPVNNGAQVQFEGSLCTGLVIDTTYCVMNLSGSTFNLYANNGSNACNPTPGTEITFSGSSSGVTAYYQDPQPTIFNQGFYLQNDASDLRTYTYPVDLRNSIFAYGAASGCECIAGGYIYNNLILQSPIGLLIGKGSPPAATTNLQSTVTKNVFIEGSPIYATPLQSASNSRSEAFNVATNTGNVLFDSNLIVHATGDPTNARGITTSIGVQNVTSSNNIICDWTLPVQDNGSSNTFTNNIANASTCAGTWASSMYGINHPVAFTDPTRTVASYAGTLGLTATDRAFLDAAELQQKGNWNVALTAPAVNDYIRAGFGL